MSILVSSSLAKANVFIPPFNKWNADTESICNEHGIELIKFEDGWLCMEYNKFNPFHKKWYLHAREFNLDQFIKWFDA
jgi:D-lyxose ketol-isomerase